jgi:hypothetical protein
MSPIQRGELESILNAQIAAIVVLSRHLKWMKLSLVDDKVTPIMGFWCLTLCELMIFEMS